MTATEMVQAEKEALLADPLHDVPSQDEVDIVTMRGNLISYEQQLAAAKLAWHASHAGVPGLDHPNVIGRQVKSLHAICDLLTVFLRDGRVPDPPGVLLPDEAT